MSSNLRVNNILPSVGTNVAIGTAGGSITLTGGVTATTISGLSTVGVTTVYTNSINNGQLGGSRNIIINGSMVVNQRGFTGTAGTTTNNAYTTDRFFIQYTHDGAVSAGQTSMNSTVGGNAYIDGFQNALIFRVTTADSSLAAGQYQIIRQNIEGYNVQGIKKGTANAQPVTLSFWCRSTTTGTYIAELEDVDNTRAVSQAYTINSANTWEKKALTFPADTTGVFDNDNNGSLFITWFLAAGSTYSGGATLQTSWGNTTANRAVGQVNLLATAGNDFFLTGVQLEVGDRATEFERRSYGQELALCQRYYQFIQKPMARGVAGGGSSFNRVGMLLPITMRTAPSVTISGSIDWYDGSGTGTVTSSNIAASYSTINGIEFDFTMGSVTAQYRPIIFYNGSSTGSFVATAEL